MGFGDPTYTPEGGGPLISFNTDKINPPSNLYFTREDVVTVTSWCSVAGVILNISGRVMLPGGRVVPFVYQQQPSSSRTAIATQVPVPEGFLLNLYCQTTGTAIKRGQCLVLVTVGRGDGTARTDHLAILQDYVASNLAVAWPGNVLRAPTDGPGVIRVINGTVPGLGADISETVPFNARWRLMSLDAILTTSATVATRRPVLQLDAGSSGNRFAQMPHPQTAPASASGAWNWAEGMALAAVVQSSSDMAGIPAPMLLEGGYRITTSTTNIQVGDQWGGPCYIVEEWINP